MYVIIKKNIQKLIQKNIKKISLFFEDTFLDILDGRSCCQISYARIEQKVNSIQLVTMDMISWANNHSW